MQRTQWWLCMGAAVPKKYIKRMLPHAKGRSSSLLTNIGFGLILCTQATSVIALPTPHIA